LITGTKDATREGAKGTTAPLAKSKLRKKINCWRVLILFVSR